MEQNIRCDKNCNCSNCQNKKMINKKYYGDHKDELNEKHNKWVNNNRDKANEISRNSYNKNREAILARKKAKRDAKIEKERQDYLARINKKKTLL